MDISGLGIDVSNTHQLRKIAKRKLISLHTVLRLVDVAKRKGKDRQVKSYWNTYHCINKIYSINGRAHGKYCKNRICTVCSANRKADLINRYYPFLQTWEEHHFLTLTTTAVPAKHLRKRIDEMLKVFTLIKEKYRKRVSRNNETKLKGVRSFECNFNPVRRTYNPHLHIITNSYKSAKILNVEWLNYMGKERARPIGQHLKKVHDLSRDLIEIIKYGSKIFTEPDLERMSLNKITPYVYVAALDNILSAMTGLRLFERFGFNLPQPRIFTNIKTIASGICQENLF